MKTPNQRGFTLIEIMIVVAIIGILTAITIPSIRDAIDRSRLRVCGINRKNIDGAKVQWAVDQKRALTEVPTDVDLFGKGTYIEHKPECPSGGAYALNAVDDHCTCSIPPHR